MNVENPQVNGHGYLDDIARVPVGSLQGNAVRDGQLGDGDGPTIPLGHRTSGRGTEGGYQADGDDTPHDGGTRDEDTGGDVFSPKPNLSAEATEDVSPPQAAPPSRGPGKWLRSLIGVDETLLDRVWEERARYTGLGAIVLGTAAMATLAMLDALDQIFGPVWPVLVLVALFWGVFICGIDR